MANVTTELKVRVTAVGKAQLDQLSKQLNKVAVTAKDADIDFKKLGAELKKAQQVTGTRTINNLKAYGNAWRDIANNVEAGTKEFKEATAEAAKLDKQLAKVQGRRQTGGRLRGAVGVAGAAAAAGIFGGPEGALGALAGGVIGGRVGAAVGGAIGAQVGALRQAAGATAEYAANITKLRIALLGVTTSQAEYQEGLQFIQQTTKDFAIPQEVVTRQFTKLQASVQGAGGNLEDTKTAFNGIVAAVRATGGSLADVDSALTATAQVFSKGKVSAEELRQQIGERLPGAFTLFAESMGKTPAELDKALEQGQVSLQDFQKFAEAIFERYGENAKTIASGPESAGDRLKVVLERLSESVGTLLEPIGAAFQNTFTFIVEFIKELLKALQDFFIGWRRLAVQRMKYFAGGQSRAISGRVGHGRTKWRDKPNCVNH
jgi:tape measure domain-containing protein